MTTEALHPNIMSTILHSNVINFVIVVCFLTYLVKKFNIGSVIKEKVKSIASNIANAENERANAEEKLEITRTKVKNVHEETKKITTEASNIAQSLSTRILKESEAEVIDIQKKTEKIIQTEKETAASEVAKEISKAAFVIAEEHIKQSIDGDMHKKFINEFLDSLEDIKV